MSRLLAVTDQEEDCYLQSLIQSEQNLYPSLFNDNNDIFHSELGEDNKIDAEKLAVCHNKSEETGVGYSMEEIATEHVEAPHYYDSNALEDFNFTSTTAPPDSRSNPETPTEPLEMSFDAKPVEMTRIVSEQSSLAPRLARYVNSELEARPISHGQNQVFSAVATNAPKSRAGTPGPRSRVSSISGVSTPIARPQAGSEQINRYEPAARFSNVRQHIGPSGLRNSISISAEDYDRPPSSSSQHYPHPVQANIGNSPPNEQIQSHGTQYQHDFGSPSPQLWHADQHASPYKSQMHMHNKSDFIGNFTSNDQFPGIFNTHSPHIIHPSPFGEDPSHANMTQENVNLSQYQGALMLDQAANHFPYPNQQLLQHGRTSGFDQGNLPNMSMRPENYPSEVGHPTLKFASLEHARREKSVSTLNPEPDDTVPQTAEDDRHYVAIMLEAMLDMSVAEDNAGMKRTWETMRRDRDKVEKAAWEILNLCKERHRRNGPFEMSPKASHTFKTFGERFETICQAMQAQKTLCKHLLRQPFSEEVVEDPGAAVSRIRNNRKVNLGKKEAIDKGREALGEKGRGKGRRTTKVVQEDTDDDFEGDDDEYGSQAGAQMYNSKKRSVSYSNAPNSRRRQASTDDPRDQSYREGSASKKVKRASRSVYQLNDQNQMVDTSQQQLKAERGPMQQSSHEHLHVGSPYGFHSITGVADAHPDDPLFGSSADVDFGQHQQAQPEGLRRLTRH